MQRATWLPETKVQPRSRFSVSRGESGWSLMSSVITRSQVRRQLAAMASGIIRHRRSATRGSHAPSRGVDRQADRGSDPAAQTRERAWCAYFRPATRHSCVEPGRRSQYWCDCSNDRRRISASPRGRDLTPELSGLAESRTNSRSRHEHLGRKGTREAIRRRSLECGLETFRSTRGLHKSETRKALAERTATVRSPASMRGHESTTRLTNFLKR